MSRCAVARYSGKWGQRDSATVHQLFFDLAQQAGAKDPKALAKQLVVLYDGAGISAWMDHDPSAETTARTVAAALVDAAIPSS